MGRYNEIMTGRYNRFLQKLLQMKGPAPAPQLAGDIAATFTLFNGPENRYLESWDRFALGVNVAASPANLSGVRLRNPITSNVVAVLERITVSESTNDVIAVRWGNTNADLGTLQSGTGARLDARGRQSPTLIMSFQNSAAAVPVLTGQFTIDGPDLLARTPYQVITFEEQELTMLPGDATQVEASTVNQNLRVFIWWRERALEESERT